jgi:hypothetical protein
MALKSYKPTTPGQRGLVLIDRSELWKGRPVKSLTEGLTGKGGRNNTGRITMRRRGGGVRGIPRGGYLARVLVDGRPPLNGRFVVTDGASHQTEVVVAYDSGTIEGTATAPDGAPLKNAEIFLLPQNPVLPSDLSETSVDETGAFSIQVGPGRYDIYALPREADWNLADAADRQRLAGYRASVGVVTGQTATVKVKLAPLSSW